MNITIKTGRIPAKRDLHVTIDARTLVASEVTFREIAYRHYTPKGGYDLYIVESWWSDAFDGGVQHYLDELWPGNVNLIAPQASSHEQSVREELASYRVIQAHASHSDSRRVSIVIYGLVYLAKRKEQGHLNMFSQSWSPTLHGCFRVKCGNHIQFVQSVTKLRRL